MDLLFQIENNDYISLFYNINTNIRNIYYKIKIDISKKSNKSTIISIFNINNLSWNILFEDNYNEVISINNMNNDISNSRNLKINEYIINISKILIT